MKFLYGYFNQDTGESVVTLADRYGTYTGQAKLHPDDKDNASQYMGCGLAQRRAWIKALQNRRRRIKIKIQAIKEIIVDINVFANDYADINKRLKCKLKSYNKEIENIENLIKEIQNNINKRIEVRDNLINKNK